MIDSTVWRAGAAALLLLCSACGGDERLKIVIPAGKPSILLISIDTLRADHLGTYGYAPYADPVSPNIDALADAGIRFERCYAPRGQTVPSLTSMMVGKYPTMHGIRENSQSFRGDHATLFEILGPAGYETRAFVAYIPASRDGNPARGADVLELGIDPSDQHQDQAVWDDRTARKVVDWLGSRPASEVRPFFAWVHFYDVHRPYAPPSPYDRMFVGDYSGPLLVEAGAPSEAFNEVDGILSRRTVDNEALSPADHGYVLSLYDGGIRSTDRHVGHILDALRASGLEDQTLVILTADHGEELADHNNYYFHGNSVYEGTLRIPLIMRWPGALPAGRAVDDLVQNLDLLPTLLRWLRLPLPEGVEGLAWTGSKVARSEAFIEWQDLIVAVRNEDYQYVSNPSGIHPRKPPYFYVEGKSFRIECEELYDLRTDPLEQDNRVRELPDVAKALQDRVRAHRERPGVVQGWDTVEDDVLLEQLRALGYVGALPGRPDVLVGAEDCTGAR